MTADSETQPPWPTQLSAGPAWSAQYSAADEIGDVQGDHIDPGQLIAVASLSAFLGAFTKDMSSAAGKAGAQAVREAARRLHAHLREHARHSERITIERPQGRLVVVEKPASLPPLALEKLLELELPEGSVWVSWDSAAGRWRCRSEPGPHPRR